MQASFAVKVTLDDIVDTLTAMGLSEHEDRVSTHLISNRMETLSVLDVAAELLKAGVPGSVSRQVKNALVKRAEGPTQVCVVCVCVCVHSLLEALCVCVSG